MKVLFVYGALTLEKTAKGYHHNFLQDIIDRYSLFGDLTICTLLREEPESRNAPVDLTHVHHYPLTKENTIYSRFINRTYNKSVLRREVRNTDFLIVHVPNTASDLAARYARKYNKPYLAVVVGCPWDTLRNYGYKGKVLAPLCYFSMRKTVKNADFVQYVTQRFLQNRYPSKALQTGCSDVFIRAINEENIERVRRRIGGWKQSTSRHIATIGSIDVPFKGQAYVIQALAKLNESGYEYHYHLIGGGDGRALRALVSRLNVAEYVHFEGPVDHEHIFDRLCAMDLYAQPSDVEGLPRSVVEAMSVGLPVIASKIGGMPELISEDCLFGVGQVDQIVRLLHSDNAFWIEQSRQNADRASEYLYDTLKRRRDDFLERCYREVRNKKR